VIFLDFSRGKRRFVFSFYYCYRSWQ